MRFKIEKDGSGGFELVCVPENGLDMLFENSRIEWGDLYYREEIEQFYWEGTEPGWHHYYKWFYDATMYLPESGEYMRDPTVLEEYARLWRDAKVLTTGQGWSGLRPCSTEELQAFVVCSHLLHNHREVEERETRLAWVVSELRKTKIDKLLDI